MIIVCLVVRGRRFKTHSPTYSSTPDSKGAALRQIRHLRILTFSNHQLKGPNQCDHWSVIIRPLPHQYILQSVNTCTSREIYKIICVVVLHLGICACVLVVSKTPPTNENEYTEMYRLVTPACTACSASVRGASNGQQVGAFPESTAVLERSS